MLALFYSHSNTLQIVPPSTAAVGQHIAIGWIRTNQDPQGFHIVIIRPDGVDDFDVHAQQEQTSGSVSEEVFSEG